MSKSTSKAKSKAPRQIQKQSSLSSSSSSSSMLGSRRETREYDASDCDGYCEWELNTNGEWDNVCCGCSPDQVCREPTGLAAESASGASTPCEDLSSSSTASGDSELPARMRKTDVLLRIPKVDDPTVCRSFLLNLSSGSRTFRQMNLGWNVTLKRVRSGPNPPEIVPATAPVGSSVCGTENSVSAMVILPEEGAQTGFNQYWVPVLERCRRAILKTPEWTVEFVRVPSR